MHKRDKKIKTRTIHICLTDINCSGLRSFSSTFITVYRAHCSLVGTVQHTFLGGDFMTLTIMFQSLIGTVQQQCLLRFLFSLYPIFPVFQSFSPKKSVNLFIVNSRKALILLAFLFLSKIARRFTDFFTFDNLLFECPTLNFYRKPKI